MDKKEKTVKAKQEDIVLTKVLYWIVGAVVLEFLLLLLNRFYVNYTVDTINIALALQTVLTVLSVVFPICFLGCVAMLFKHQKQCKRCAITRAATIMTAALSICCIVSRVYRDGGVSLLYVVVPVVAVLAIVYYLYQREFFACAILSTLGMLGVRLSVQTVVRPAMGYTFIVVLAVVVVAFALSARTMQGTDGVLKVGGKDMAILPKKANYAMLYVTCAVVALVVIAALVAGVHVALYGVLVAWLLVLAVYYTVKLM